MHSQGKPRQMDSISISIVEMAQGSEHGLRHSYSFSQRTFIKFKRNKRPTTISKYNSLLRDTSHRLAVYKFRFDSYIPRTYTTNVFHSYWKQKTGPKWSSQIITQILKLIYGQWIHRSNPRTWNKCCTIKPRN